MIIFKFNGLKWEVVIECNVYFKINCKKMASVCKKLLVHYNMFKILLDVWYIIKNCAGPTALGPS